MKTIQNADVFDRIHGIQLLVFELIWPRPWLSSLHMTASSDTCSVYAKTGMAPNDEEWESFVYSFGEILDEAFREVGVRCELLHGGAAPSSQEYDVIFNQATFTAIAKDHAPWRLENEPDSKFGSRRRRDIGRGDSAYVQRLRHALS